MIARDYLKMAVGPSPHIHTKQSTGSIVLGVILCLVPQAVWSVIVYGERAAMIILAGIGGSILAEIPFCLIHKRNSLLDATAILTGLLVAFIMPPTIPLFVPISASAFAIIVVKWTFGGVGANWMNPALAGMTFAWLSWPNLFNQYTLPKTISGIVGVSGPTPLQMMHSSQITGSSFPFGPGINITDFAKDCSIFLDSYFFSFFNVKIPPEYLDLFFGNRAGSIGEGSIFLILLGTIFLVSFELIRIEIPLSLLFTFLALQYVFGGIPNGNLFFEGDLLFSLFSGSIVLSAFFCATDPVTSPSSFQGRIIYGILIGLLCFCFRMVGSRSEGTGFAILLANCIVPSIDEGLRFLRNRRRNKGI